MVSESCPSRENSHRFGMNVDDAEIIAAERDASPVRFGSFDRNENSHAQCEHFRANQRDEAVEEQVDVEAEVEDVVDDEGSQQASTGAQLNEPLEPIETQTSTSGSFSQNTATRRRQRQGGALTDADTRVEHDFMQYLDRHPTALARISEQRLQHSMTVGTTRSIEGVYLPDFGAGKSYPACCPEQENHIVEFSGWDDPRHAQNWKTNQKLITAAILIFDSTAATLASSIFAPATEVVAKRFNVGTEVVTLNTSLFVLGYAVGPIVFGPLSELYGRRLPIIIGAFGFGIFNTAVATAENFQTVVICRFFAGVFGSAPLALTAAILSDMYDNKSRGLAVATFVLVIFDGLFCGPIIGGFITKSYLGWRWTAWILAFMGYASGVLSLLFQRESYGPAILVAKASELRRLTHNWNIHAKQEEVEIDFNELVSKNLSRPLRILFEPIVLLVTIYMGFIYGLLYFYLTAFDLIFGNVHGFSLGVEGLPYIAIIIGQFFGLLAFIVENKSYIRKLEANNNVPVPEWRLPLVAVGGIAFTISLFWLGWTGFEHDVPWIVPTVSGGFLGFGFFTVFLQCLNYIIDAYLMFAASAVTANTVMRSIFGAIFPLFALYMFEGLGIKYAMTLLGCVSILFIPVPFLFYFYGKRIRGNSKFIPATDAKEGPRRAAQFDEESRIESPRGSATVASNDTTSDDESSDQKKID